MNSRRTGSSPRKISAAMVRFVIRAADAHAPVQIISASRGKVLRAEPVSALYEQGLVHHVGRFAVLEDQLCAFTTQGYRGEGSPDHADALVFAITDMLKENASILEFYRRQAVRRQQPSEHRADGEHIVRLQAPVDASVVHGLSGTLYIVEYIVDAGRILAVKPEDAAALLAAGFTRVAGENA
jgi:hypothetical protein